MRSIYAINGDTNVFLDDDVYSHLIKNTNNLDSLSIKIENINNDKSITYIYDVYLVHAHRIKQSILEIYQEIS